MINYTVEGAKGAFACNMGYVIGVWGASSAVGACIRFDKLDTIKKNGRMDAANEGMLQIAVNAAAGGHDMTGFEPVQDQDGDPNGHQAVCRRCGLSAWVDDSGMQYSLLAADCPGGPAS